MEEINTTIWRCLSNRLSQKIDKETNNQENSRYINQYIKVPYLKGNLKGIFNFFNTYSNLNDEVKVKLSSYGGGNRFNCS